MVAKTGSFQPSFLGILQPAATQERLLPLLPASWHQEMLYFVEDEFSNKVFVRDDGNKKIQKIDGELAGYDDIYTIQSMGS